MATILIIEDRPTDRKLLATILRARHHVVVEAVDGEDALTMLSQLPPDLVISDICMPKVDGYEFVRRMREHPALATTPVIFYTATYHEREARTLARQYDVVDVLTKPSEPDVILARVEAALALDRAPLELDSSMATQADRPEAEQQRAAAVAQLAQEMAVEREPAALVAKLCQDVRRLTLAQHAVVELLDAERPVTGPLPSVRKRNPGGRPEALGLPADLGPVSSLLNVPIASATKLYGWLSLRNKLGAEEFTEGDELTAASVGMHAGVAYEYVSQLAHLQDRVTTVEQDLRRLSARARARRRRERTRLSRLLHDEVGQTLAGLKMDLHSLGLALQGATHDSQLDQRIESILQRLTGTIVAVRQISGALRPRATEERGLIATIESHVREFERRSGIACQVAMDADLPELDRGRSMAVFRIVREALTNIRQHAGASLATVSAKVSDGWLVISIVDDGRGIPESELTSPDSLGVIGMRERASLLAGRLEVARREPTGTVVTLTVPLADRRQKPRA